EEALEGIGYFGIEIIGYPGRVKIWAGRIDSGIVGRLHELVANRGRQEVAVAGRNAIYGTPSAGPGQVRAAVCGVVHAHHDLPREHVLKSEVPHVDLGIPRRSGVQVAGVAEAP